MPQRAGAGPVIATALPLRLSELRANGPRDILPPSVEIEGRLHRRPLVHDVARIAVPQLCNLRSNSRRKCQGICSIRKIYPQVKITRSSHGYLTEDEQRKFVAEVAAARTDILWVCLGVPREQQFYYNYYKWRRQLTGVGVVKTRDGLLNFLSGSCRRAPRAMQNVGLEWLFRVAMESRQLFFRYLCTTPHAIILLLFRTGRFPSNGGSSFRRGNLEI